MTASKTVLLMSRGARLNYMFRPMAAELAGRHRVVVLAFPDEVELYAGLRGVDVRVLESWDVAFAWRDDPAISDATLRERAHVIEQALGMPLYKAAACYLLYGRVVRSYGGYWPFLNTERDCLLAFVESFEALSKIFEEVRPDVVFYESVDLISTYVALALASRRGVFALQMMLSPINVGGVSAGYGAHRENIVLRHLYANRELITDSSYAAADAILADPKAALYTTTYATFNRNTLGANSLFSAERLSRIVQQRAQVMQGVRNLRWHIRSVGNRAWLNRHLSRSLPVPPYVAFPVNYLPEATTCSQAPRCVDQNAIVEQLALNAPSWLKIVVKEHPRSYGRRGASFFGPLMRLPNVVVCHPHVSNYELLTRAEAILTITGTSGFEGLVFGKKVGVLGRPFYAAYAGVRKLFHPEELYEALADPSWAPEDMREERRVFLAAHAQSQHDFGLVPDRWYPADGGVKWARALEETMVFIDTHGLKPLQFDSGLGAWR